MATPNIFLAPAGTELVVRGQTVSNVSSAIALAQSLADPQQRVQAFGDIATHIEQQKEKYQGYEYELYEATQQDSQMKQVVNAAIANEDDHHHQLWATIKKAHKSEKEKRARYSTLRDSIAAAWGNLAKDSLMPCFETATGNRMKDISALVNRRHGVDWLTIQGHLRDAAYDRVQGDGGRQGVQKTPELSTIDFKMAFKAIDDKKKSRTLPEYRTLGYHFNSDGWLEENSTVIVPEIVGPRVEEVDDDDEPIHTTPTRLLLEAPPTARDDPYTYLSDDDETDEAAVDAGEAEGPILSQPQVDKHSTSQPAQTQTRKRAANDDTSPYGKLGATRTSKRRRGLAPGEEAADAAAMDELMGEDDDVPMDDAAEEEEADPTVASDDDEPGVDTEALKCKCSKGIPANFKQEARKPIPPKDLPMQHRLARRFRDLHVAGNVICFKHTHATAGNIGFQIKKLKHPAMTERILEYVKHLDASTLDKYKEGRGLFRKSHRQALEEDGLGPYRFKHSPITFELTEKIQEELQDSLGIDFAEWKDRGSVNVACFDWMKDFTVNTFLTAGKQVPEDENLRVYDVVLQEFEMYRYHQRLVNGKHNMGWLRNILYSLSQQAMRMSLRYYAMYCALRPDRTHRLVSYPYYAKYQTVEDGDSTFFRHIDIAIEAAVSRGRGINAIQGTVSLDDEQEDDCTEILPGMHTRMEEWHSIIKDRPEYKSDPRAFVSRITDKHFTKDDKEHFGFDWTAVPCKALEVRITDSRLPHGAQGAKRVRRTMLPWYCGIDNDGSLEMPEAGTFDDLAAAHRDLIPGRNTPSGLANRYSSIPYQFPAAVHLPITNVLAKSLIGQVNLNLPSLISYKKKFFTDVAFRQQEILTNERELAAGIFKMWPEVKELEEEAFGDKSYFFRVHNGLSTEWDAGQQDPSANDQEYQEEFPHGGTLEYEDGHGEMVGSDVLETAIVGDATELDEGTQVQMAMAASLETASTEQTAMTPTTTPAVSTPATTTASSPAPLRRSTRLSRPDSM